jgi:DNA-directed RNA polymerase beta subunit
MLDDEEKKLGIRDMDDVGAIRENVTTGVASAIQGVKPLNYGGVSLSLHDVTLGKSPDLSYAAQKKALLNRGSVGTPVYGTWRLTDTEGKVLDEKKKLLANVPTINNGGTYIRRGIEYSLANQGRLRFGIYTHKKLNGELESHFNVEPGTGNQFKLKLEPDTGKFVMRVGQANLPIVPILRAMGTADEKIKQVLGQELFDVNTARLRGDVVAKAVESLGGRDKNKHGDLPTDENEALRTILAKARLDPDVNTKTLVGKPYDHVSPDAILDSVQALVKLHSGKAPPDNRNNQLYQRVWSHEDLFPERIKKDAGGILRKVMWQVSRKKSLDAIPSGIFNKHLDQVLLGSGLSQSPEETNPTEVLDQLHRVVRIGEGAIPTIDAVPDDARAVQGSYAGFIDPIRSPESEKVGVDNRFAHGVRKGKDGQIYTKMLDVKTGKQRLVSADEAGTAVVAFPHEMDRPGNDRVRAVVQGRIQRVDRDQVNLVMAHPANLFTMQSNLMPSIGSVAGGRVFLGAKFVSQALPLINREAPLVQAEHPDGESFESKIGRKIGTVASDRDGLVTNVTDDEITVEGPRGQKVFSIANFVPYNRKTFLKHHPSVKIGDRVTAGQLLATSNMTDKNGNLALGTNLRVAYVPFSRGGGNNYEDAIVLSESGAKKLTAEQMYTHKLDFNEGKPDAAQHRSLFPGIFNKKQLDRIGPNGIILPGSTVEKGDPIVLAVRQRDPKKPGMGKSNSSRRYADASILWDHDHPGYITDSAIGPNGVVVASRVENPIHVGDKMAGRFGDKHIVSAIVPDAQMPVDEKGNVFHAIVNPHGIISRGNPAQIAEAAWGRIAELTGKPSIVPSMSLDDLNAKAKEGLAFHGLRDTSDMFDPVLNRKIANIASGNRFYMRLHHLAEGKLTGRSDTGNFNQDGEPSKGGGESAPRVGLMEVNALYAAGANHVLDDTHQVKGSRNEDYWRAIRMGFSPPAPKSPEVLKKFLALLAASGVNVQQEGSRLHVMAMTDSQVDDIAQGEIKVADTVRFPDMQPIDGGLFDRGITGGHGGDRFGKIELGVKIPNPVMEEPIRKLLGLTEKSLRNVMSGKDELNGETGPKAIAEALRGINVDREIENAKQKIRTAKRSPRDAAIKKLRVLEMFKRTDLKPEDMMISKLPVLPPSFRPISMMNDVPLVNGSNMLYKDLLQAKENYHGLLKSLGPANTGDEMLAVYDAAKAVVGLGEPINKETQQRRAKGLLSVIFGDSPKNGTFQRKMMGKTVNLGGRAVITPDPRLNMDQVGVPEEILWKSYAPFVMRRMVRRGMKPLEAQQAIKERTPSAYGELHNEMQERPVMINRAPSLHRYSIMAAWPVLTKAKSLRISPVVTSAFNADFDGDTMAVHVPASDKAIEEMIDKLMPSRQLLSTKNFKAHFLPRQEYQLGLYEATKPSAKKNPVVFEDLKAAIRAFRQGQLNLDDIIEVPGAQPHPTAVADVTQGLLS